MKHGRPAVEKEALDYIQRSRTQFLEYAQSETLSDRRVDTIEDRVCSCAFNPLGALSEGIGKLRPFGHSRVRPRATRGPVSSHAARCRPRLLLPRRFLRRSIRQRSEARSRGLCASIIARAFSASSRAISSRDRSEPSSGTCSRRTLGAGPPRLAATRRLAQSRRMWRMICAEMAKKCARCCQFPFVMSINFKYAS
jgi:hypothetical protein